MDGILKSLMDKLITLVRGIKETLPAKKSTSGFRSVQTSATGANYVTLPDEAAKSLLLMNSSGATIELQKDGSGATISINDGYGLKLDYLTNSNQIAIRRQDQSNTQVTISYILEV